MPQRPIQKPKTLTLPMWAWLLIGFFALAGGLAAVTTGCMSWGAH